MYVTNPSDPSKLEKGRTLVQKKKGEEFTILGMLLGSKRPIHHPLFKLLRREKVSPFGILQNVSS
jgi:hypothetical protein